MAIEKFDFEGVSMVQWLRGFDGPRVGSKAGKVL